MPIARRGDIVDTYFGTTIADPYRWLEDATSPETLTWVTEQNAATRAYIDATDRVSAIKARLTTVWDFPKYSAPERYGGRYFYTANTGLQNQSVLFMRPSLRDEPRLILDPNALSDDGTVAVTSYAINHDGTFLAYSVATHGSDWHEVHVRNIDTGIDEEEVLHYCRFTDIAWRHDSAGFFYSRFPAPETVAEEDQTNFCRVYFHRLGTAQTTDTLVHEQSEQKQLAFNPETTDDGCYVVLSVWDGTDPKNRIYYRAMEGDDPFIRLIDEPDATYTFIGNKESIFYFLTTLDAARGRIIAIDIEHPDRENWREIIPQHEDSLVIASFINHQLVVLAMHDAMHVIRRFTLDGAPLGEIPLPELGSIIGISGKPDQDELFLSFTSFLRPPEIYRYDFVTEQMEPYLVVTLPFDTSAYETTQVFYPSKDGTRIPLFLTAKKGLTLDGNNPTLLYGYGGFNVSLTPTFSTARLIWLEQGGVYAQASLRGGNEYGEEWHEAGTLERKQNVFDDFIAAGEWLIANRYTRRELLAIEGGSNGGLLVAACETQRPDLFGAIICRVPVIDMLRYHRFTIGRYWTSDYGNAESSEEHFRFLRAYSPLHNVREGATYPATLILSADTDDRVVPAHAKKFAATMQWANAGPHPILLRVETKAGHGLGKPTSKIIEEQADIYAFLFHRFEMK